MHDMFQSHLVLRWFRALPFVLQASVVMVVVIQVTLGRPGLVVAVVVVASTMEQQGAAAAWVSMAAQVPPAPAARQALLLQASVVGVVGLAVVLVATLGWEACMVEGRVVWW